MQQQFSQQVAQHQLQLQQQAAAQAPQHQQQGEGAYEWSGSSLEQQQYLLFLQQQHQHMQQQHVQTQAAPRGEDAALIARVSELLPDFDSYFGAEEADPRSSFYRIPSFRTRTGSAHHERHSSLGLNLKLLDEIAEAGLEHEAAQYGEELPPSSSAGSGAGAGAPAQPLFGNLFNQRGGSMALGAGAAPRNSLLPTWATAAVRLHAAGGAQGFATASARSSALAFSSLMDKKLSPSPRNSADGLVGAPVPPSIDADLSKGRSGAADAGRARKAMAVKKNILVKESATKDGKKKTTVVVPKSTLTSVNLNKDVAVDASSFPLSVKKRPLTSKFKGVCWYKRTNKWVVQVKLQGVRAHIGYFDNELQAAQAYTNAMEEINLKLGNKFKMPAASTEMTQ